MVSGKGENVKLWHHNGPCVRSKCDDSMGDSHCYLPTYFVNFVMELADHLNTTKRELVLEQIPVPQPLKPATNLNVRS